MYLIDNIPTKGYKLGERDENIFSLANQNRVLVLVKIVFFMKISRNVMF